MKKTLLFLALITTTSAFCARPSSYTELLDYVQEGPDQGETATCLFVGNTGAMELLANKHDGIKNPEPYGKNDLAESYLIYAPFFDSGTSYIDEPVHRLQGGGISLNDWPYDAWSDTYINKQVWWDHPNRDNLPMVKLPAIETIRLFQYGSKFSQYVLGKEEIEQIKEAMWTHKSPILVNYVDDAFWHVITLVGYDDDIPGECYDMDEKECSGMGAFYIRDSFGVRVQLRDYDWFRFKGNAAFVVKLKDQ